MRILDEGRRIAAAAASAVFLLGLLGCAGHRYAGNRAVEDSGARFQPGDIIHTQTGERISFETLVDELLSARVIYVGETHSSIEDHRIQERIMKALLEHDPSLILAMEMFPRELQPELDLWSTGLLKEEAFLEAVRWKQTWGFPFRLYRGLLTKAGERQLKVLAINAPQEIVGKIAREGLPSLSRSERDRIALELDLGDSEHRARLKEFFKTHVQGEIKDFQSFYEAQLAWEETMAETLAQTLRASGENERILVIIGNGHIRHRRGVPQRALRRYEHVYKTVSPTPARALGDAPYQASGMLDPQVADFIWVTEGKEMVHPPRGRLGVVIRPHASGEGLEVTGVMPGSPAEKAGFQKGDVIFEINGRPVETMEDLNRAMAESQKSPSLVRVRRNGEVLPLEVAPSRPEGKEGGSE